MGNQVEKVIRDGVEEISDAVEEFSDAVGGKVRDVVEEISDAVGGKVRDVVEEISDAVGATHMEGGRVITVGSSRIERWQLRRGDHIYCWRGRCGFSYSHHGIYESHCKVIQFCSPNTGSPSSLLSSFSPTRSCPECAAAERRGGVVISCLDCFQENDNICLFAYSVPPWFRNMLLSCTTIPTCLVERADDPETVLRRANNKLASGFGSYDLLTNNCVDFAIYCKTGRYDVLARFN